MNSKNDIIPLNTEYERKIFSRNNLDYDCDTIWRLTLNVEKAIKALRYLRFSVKHGKR
jgi:hypothetical protein